jgi:hypothetical protein
MRAQVLVAAVAVALCAGCVPTAPASGGTGAAGAWQQVELPAGVRPASLAVAGDGLLVGGQTTDPPAPRLLRLASGRPDGEFALDPAEPTAAKADLVLLTVAGDDVYAIGTMTSGAHSNARLTTWDGTLGSARLTSRPQEFFTFGGHDAGPLLGTVVVAGEPVIAGTRVDQRGPYGLLWTRSGHTWSARPTDPVLMSSPDRELSFTGLGRLDDRIVVVGDELGLAGGLLQQPALFHGTVTGDWTELLLPLPDGMGKGGELNRATSVACVDGHRTCWVSGWGRGHPLVWPVTFDADGAATSGPVVALLGDPPAGNGPVSLVTLAGGRPLVLTNAAAPSVQQGCPDGWRELAAPPGRATAVTSATDAVYAVAGDRLWRLAVPGC